MKFLGDFITYGYRDKNMKIEMFIDIIPIGKGRPRVSTRGGFARAYTPKRTATYETIIRNYAEEHCNMFEADIPLKCKIIFYMPIPKSTPRKLRDKLYWHTKKPDTDNCLKAVLDALNGVAYEDDSQIVIIKSKKIYSERPGILIKISEVKSHRLEN